AVIGSEVADSLHLHLYDDKQTEEQNLANGGAFRATHGMPSGNEVPDIHKPRWHIVGILKPTHTANDRVLFIPFISLYAIAEHDDIVPDLPQQSWELSAIMVKSRNSLSAMQLMYNFKVIDDRAAAINPASVMREFFNTFFSRIALVFLLIALLVTVVAAVGI